MCYERKDLFNKDLEAVWCNIYNEESSFVFGSVYIPPESVDKAKLFLEVVSKLLCQNLPVIITGDFNAHHLGCGDGSCNK